MTFRRAGLLTLVALLSVSCEQGSTGPDSGDDTPAGPNTPLPTLLRAGTDTLTFQWIGATATISASVLDAAGAVMPDQHPTWRASDSTIVTVDAAGTATARKVGTLRLFVELGTLADTVVVRVIQVPASVEVAPGSVTFAALGDTSRVSAVVKDKGGVVAPDAAVVWSSADGAVATVDATGRVLALKNGTTTLRATSGPVTKEIGVQVAQVATTLALDQASVSFTWLKQTRTLRATARDRLQQEAPGATLTWRSSAPAVVTVDGSGQITAVGVGQAVVTVTSGTAETSANVNVVQTPDRVRILPGDARLTFFGDSVRLTAALVDSGGSPISGAPAASWTSSSPSAPVVGGLVTMGLRGTVTITATIGAFSGQVPVVCQQVIDHLVMSQTEIRMPLAGPLANLTATPVDKGGTSVPTDPSSFTSRSPAVASVTVLGLITPRAVGQTWIVATNAGRSDSTRVTVTTDRYWLDYDSLEIAWGYTSVLVYGRFLEADGTVTRIDPPFAFRNPAVARKSSVPRIEGTGEGKTWAVSEYSGQRDSLIVVVEGRPNSFSVEPIDHKLQFGEVVPLYERLGSAERGSVGGLATWTSRDPSVISLQRRADGVMLGTALKGGSTWLVATAMGFTDSIRGQVSTTWKGNLVITNRAEYERARDAAIDTIDGSLTISGAALTTLVGLETIRIVTGNVVVENNPALADLDGLAFKSITGSLTIRNNPAARSMRNIGGLAFLRNNLSIIDNPMLPIPAFTALPDVDQINIRGNAGFAAADLFPSLKQVTETIGITQAGTALEFSALEIANIGVYIAGPGEVRFTAPSTTISGLTIGGAGTTSFVAPRAQFVTLSVSGSGLVTLDVPAATPTSVSISGNPALREIRLSAITTTNLTISGNSALSEVRFPTVTSGNLSITDNPQLTAVRMPVLASGSMTITGNALLTTLDMPLLATSPGVTITKNPALGSLDFPALRSVNELLMSESGMQRLDWGRVDVRSARISKMPALGTMTLGSTAITSYGLRVETNPALTSIVLPNVTGINFVVVKDDPALTTLSAPLLATVVSLDLAFDYALVAPSMPSLRRVDYGVYLYRNHAMTNLDWLSGMTRWIPEVLLNQNNALVDIMGLRNAGDDDLQGRAIGGLQITGNTALTTARINQLLDTLRAKHPNGAFGALNISGNAP